MLADDVATAVSKVVAVCLGVPLPLKNTSLKIFNCLEVLKASFVKL